MASLARFLKTEEAGGILLFAAAVLAVLLDNSALAPAYRAIRDFPLSGAAAFLLGPHATLKGAIDDALMVLFFLLVGLEIKREILAGELAGPGRVLLPALAALAGMALPALIYVGVNLSSPAMLKGWAIPSATDIAFALGVLALLGSRVPPSLKAFLAAVAIFDDLGAILIIAFVYSHSLSVPALGAAAALTLLLAILNRAGVRRLWPYLLVGLALWWVVHLSGVHATIAGVILAFAIPLNGDRTGTLPSPLERLEKYLHPWVAFGVLPLFAFASAGVPFAGMTLKVWAEPVTLGIVAGLFLGKQVAILGTVRIATWTGLAPAPGGATWRQIYGVAILCGIGFTMSLFIGGLAFPATALSEEVRHGVIGGSLLSAAAGYAVLRFAGRHSTAVSPTGSG